MVTETTGTMVLSYFFGILASCGQSAGKSNLPIVVNTWAFTNATAVAWASLEAGASGLDAVVAGCGECEREQCDGTVGYGGSPDERGETTLDAMVMDGQTHDVGAVGCLRYVKNAIAVARAVMLYSKHTMLVGELATEFAKEMGFELSDLSTDSSRRQWEQWRNNSCQPNFRQNVSPDPSQSCGPYTPVQHTHKLRSGVDRAQRSNQHVSDKNHDTIGMVIVDHYGNLTAGTSTNGASHKVPGRVGDSPIPGAGAYVDNDVGGAAATGDGDVMMRFLPSYHTVERMRSGESPSDAAASAISRIIAYYPSFSGAVVAVDKLGVHGAACYGLNEFPYSVRSANMQAVTVYKVPCIKR